MTRVVAAALAVVAAMLLLTGCPGGIQSPGTSCSHEGATASTMDGDQLVCRGGKWKTK